MRDKIIELITNELKDCTQPFLQEVDLQVFLFNKFRKEFGEASVYIEYPIISPVKGKKNEEVLGYIDLLVEADGLFYPIELKYKSKPANVEFSYFGKSKTYSLKKHTAYNLNCYGFWADVARMEKLALSVNKVANGIGVFMTNDPNYCNGPQNNNVKYANFAISEGRVIPSNSLLKWKRDVDILKNHPDIKLTNKYTVKWQEMNKLNNFKLLVL